MSPDTKRHSMFSKSSKYAIRSILFLATQSTEQQRFGSKRLAEELDVPIHFLAKILQDLSRNGLISSAKGPGGGFYLTAQNQSLTILEILEAVDGNEIFKGCVLGFASCSDKNPCPIHVQVYAYREGLRYQLAHLSVTELAAKIKRENLEI